MSGHSVQRRVPPLPRPGTSIAPVQCGNWPVPPPRPNQNRFICFMLQHAHLIHSVSHGGHVWHTARTSPIKCRPNATRDAHTAPAHAPATRPILLLPTNAFHDCSLVAPCCSRARGSHALVRRRPTTVPI
jgi:hypothetical protein